jgi:hypothetical protein
MKKSAGVGSAFLMFLFCSVICFVVALNYDNSVAVGKYRFAGNGEVSSLVLNSDHSFRQNLDGAFHRP